MEEFIIPVSRDDLLKRNNSNQYCVSKLASISSLMSHISVCEQEFREKGHVFIYRMFDYLYSVLCYWNEVDIKLKEKCWDLVQKSCKKSTPAILEILNTQFSHDKQTLYRNCLKMNIYLLCQMIELFENSNQQANLVIDKGKGKKKKPLAGKMDWHDEIETALNAISQLFQCKVSNFWDPPIVEEDFVNIVTNCCYKLLENAELCKIIAIRDSITKILINMIKHYNHNLSCAVKLVQLLHCYTHIAPHLVAMCRAFVAADNMNAVIRDILTEIISFSAVDLERNSQACSSFATFLTELATDCPACIVPLLPQLKSKLDEEPYTMRNCVIAILGQMIIEIYSKDAEGAANRDLLIELIEDHVSDINGFVRAKALSTLLSIVEKCNLPLGRLAKTLKLLTGENGAIFDTSSSARKNATRIITSIVELNLSKGLSFEELKERQEEEKRTLEEVEKQIAEMPISDDIADIEKQIEFIKEQSEGGNSRTTASEPMESHSVARETLEKKVAELKGVIYIVGQMMDITGLIESAFGDVQSLLSSKVSSDVLEAISFFTKAKLSNLVNVDVCIRKMLPHICSKDDTIKSAITNAYRRLYLSIDEEELGDKDRNEFIVDSLSTLIVNPTYGEFISIEKLVVNFTESEDIDHQVVKCLWKRVVSKSADYTSLQKKCALILFSMVANVPVPFMKGYFKLLIDSIPSSDLHSLDLQLMEYTCVAIKNLVNSRKIGKLDEVNRLPRHHPLFERLCNLVVLTFPLHRKLSWVPMANEAINTIYLLAENPNIICSKLITNLAKELIHGSKENNNIPPHGSRHPAFILTRFTNVASQVALKQFIHFDVSILSELKRRNTIQEEKEQVTKTIKLAQNRRRQTMMSEKNGDNLEEEMGLVGASADDAEAEFIRKVCENDLITDPSKLLNRLLNFVVYICKSPSRFKNRDLQKIASLSLGKMMVTSSRVCMDNIDLLFHMAARSRIEIIRANLIVPLGDLIKRFTTNLEPFTPSLYGRLRDSSPIVRLNALNVLSHLILNDMIKVKGQLSEMTTCIIDGNPRISHLSRIFFQELSSKDKALYNVMPDIISRLSSPETGVKEEDFRTIMQYLMPFIHKKNQNENLFEKICARFHSSNDERSWRDLSYCLSLMNFNDAMLRALQFNLNSFAGKLHVDAVYHAITAIINTAKKTAKGEMVAVIEEMNGVIEKLRHQNVEDEEANVNAEKAANRKNKRKSKKLRDSTVTSKEKPIGKGDGDHSDDSFEETEQRSVRKTTRKVNKTHIDNEESDNDDNKSIASSRPKRTCQQAQSKLDKIFSDDSESEDEEDVEEEPHNSAKKKSLKRNLITEPDSEDSD